MESEKRLLGVVCSVLNSFLLYPVFVIFLLTSTDLAELAGPRNLTKSARICARIHLPITDRSIAILLDVVQGYC